MDRLRALREHQQALRACTRCPRMIGPVVVGQPVVSPVMLIGQAPGAREGPAGRPFAWTAGRTLFRWTASIGLAEAEFRRRVYMAAVCRCYPGKNPKGGDRVPSPEEIANCAPWLAAEFRILRPGLVIPVGRLAIARFLEFRRLDEVVGRRFQLQCEGAPCELVPLPHPSGASTWHRTEPGRGLLAQALGLIQAHPAWRSLCDRGDGG